MERVVSPNTNCERPNVKLISMKIKGLMLQEKFEEGLQICGQEPWKYSLTIISQKIKILMILKRYQEALQECTSERCTQHQMIQKQREQIINRMQNGSQNNIKLKGLNAISRQIKAFTLQKEYENALVLCRQEPWCYNPTIVHQKNKIYILTGQVLEAFKECTLESCQYHYLIQNQKMKIMRLINKKIDHNEKENVVVREMFMEDLKRSVLTKIYCDDILVEDIQLLQLDDWTKTILLAAYYDKKNPNTGMRFVKETMQQYVMDLEKQKILRRIQAKLSSKKANFFDIAFYGHLLNCSVDFELAAMIEQSKCVSNANRAKTSRVQTSASPSHTPVHNKKQTKKTTSKMIEVVGQKNTKSHMTSQNSSVHTSNNILLKDVFAYELYEIGRYLYCAMQNETMRSTAMHVADILEDISLKDIHEPNAFQNMVYKLRVVQKEFMKYFPLSISLDDEKIESIQKRYHI